MRLLIAVLVLATGFGEAQSSRKERTFPESVSVVESALKKLPGGTSGSLPILDGFVVGQKLDEYQRPYYQYTIRVSSNGSGGSSVRVSAKISAWHNNSAHPGYEVLQSTGRLETDLLDRLQDWLTPRASSQDSTAATTTRSKAAGSQMAREPEISAPTVQFPRHLETKIPLTGTHTEAENPALQQEARNLEEILRNQAHPTNLVAVRQDQTPLLQNPSLDSKVLFLGSAEDEFEIIEANADWVHVRISGLSRGWLRRSLVEVLDQPGREDVQSPIDRPEVSSNSSTSNAPFSVSSDELGSFPGGWEPLKGKTVKIVSVQPAVGARKITSSLQKLQFARGVFQKGTPESLSAGLVLIFDTEDGGMLAATGSDIEKWRKGTISEQAFWKGCYVDPPEMLGSVE